MSARKPLKDGSQCSRILAYLVEGNTLQPLQALIKFHTLHLSQRIGELKRRQHGIKKRMVRVGTKTVAEYYLPARSHYRASKAVS